jgi:hypothetical protein
MDKFRDLGEYYRENILKKYVLNDKKDSDFGGMF